MPDVSPPGATPPGSAPGTTHTPASLEVAVARDAGSVVLRLSGTLDLSSTDWFLAAIDSAVLSGQTDVVVDLSGVRHVDHHGHEALEDAAAALALFGGRLRTRSAV